MSHQSSLGGLVVVRSYNQKSVSAHSLGVLGKLDGICCIVASCACDNGYSLVYLFNSVANALSVLVIGKSGAFACGSADDDSVCAACDLHFDKLAQSRIIYGAVIVHRGNDSNACACENSIFHNISPFSDLLYM